MRTNYFKCIALATLAVGLFFTSCSDEGSDDIDNKGETEGEYGYLSFSLINNSISGVTKADPYGTPDENLVNTALIVLYDGDTPESSVVKHQIELKGGTAAAPGDDMHSISPGTNATTYKTKAQKVKKADYKLAVFLNYPAALLGVTDDDEDTPNKLEDMQAAATVTVNGLTQRKVGNNDPTTDNFLMSNFAGLVTVPKEKIFGTEDEAIASPVAVNVERAVAKVSLSLNDKISTKLDAELTDIYWDVDVINTKTFWMRQAALMLDGEGGTTDEVATETNRIKMYAKDPNMAGQSRLGDIDEDLSTEFDYKSGPITLSFAPSTTDAATAAYVTENTMNATEQWEDVTTTVLISAVLTPTKTFFASSFTEGDPYFLYRNKVFTLTDIQEIHAALDDETKMIASAGKTWKAIIAVTDNADIIALPTILEAIKANFGGDYDNFDQDTSQDAYHTNGTVSYFAAGAPNYYYVPIRHFSNTQQANAMAYGRYGVVRNNWYGLSLNSINSYGTAEVPDPEDRLDPDDKEGDWLSIVFTILPWMERNHGIDL